ncbi:MAG: PD-(D/E)XK nuclease domain-containing protein, partial [Muribaculaceae bacterium]|nr:PD-(D/E)XK nuclease domain-containing protein [Muribaculaceae bacterium]
TIETPKFVYIIELRYDSSSQQAIDQINEKQYACRYLTANRRIFKIGANFSSKTRHLNQPTIK